MTVRDGEFLSVRHWRRLERIEKKERVSSWLSLCQLCQAIHHNWRGMNKTKCIRHSGRIEWRAQLDPPYKRPSLLRNRRPEFPSFPAVGAIAGQIKRKCRPPFFYLHRCLLLVFTGREKCWQKPATPCAPVVSWNATKECVPSLVDPHRANLVKNDQLSGPIDSPGLGQTKNQANPSGHPIVRKCLCG